MEEKKEVTQPEMRNIISDSVKQYGSQKALAEAINISETYLSGILNKGLPISNTVANFYGRTLVKKYVKKE